MMKKLFGSLVFAIGFGFSVAYGGPFYLLCFMSCVAGCEAICAALTGPAAVACLPPCVEGCGASCVASCFSPSTKLITKENGVEIEKEIANIHPGDQVKTIKNGKPFWTTVTKNIKTEGLFEFIRIKANSSSNQQTIELEITPSHGVVMLVDNNKTIDIAKNLVLGDNLLASNGDMLSVTEINTVVVPDRYTLETAEGSVLASNVFVSTICSEEIANGEQLWDDKLKDWSERHRDIFSAQIVGQVFDKSKNN
ncbi:hypothetical protein [Fastidiosibacter lacustris]|uniref:hypothetical protein n=1 Tax=Fastidiosibacter lacustris TaxID=2056695 RepID=UPI0013002D7C|nr:hypothetical protein [Fastidiosibacter lacustris]